MKYEYDWGAIRFEIIRDVDSTFKVIPIGFCIGKYDIERGIFKNRKGNEIPLIEDFCIYPDPETTYFCGFPVNITTLKEMDASSFDEAANDFMYKYFFALKSYNFYCKYTCKDNSIVTSFYAVDKDENVMQIDMSKPMRFKEETPKTEKKEASNLSRREVVELMKKRVVAQDSQVESFVSAVFSNQKYGSFEGLKVNLLIIGSTGTGKTEMCRSLSKIIETPFIIKDATKYSTTGYVGNSVLEILKDLYIESGKNKELTERGIVFIDEFDKLGVKDSNTSGVRTKDVQQELLGLLDGQEYSIEVERDHYVTIDTSKITFVLGGAFQNIIDELNNVKKPMGFGSKDLKEEDKKSLVTPKDLNEKGGIEAELLRRISIIIQMNNLDKKALKQILATSEISNLKVWEKALLEIDNVTLTYQDETLEMIAEKAQKLKGGASSLKSVVTSSLEQIRCDIADGLISDCEVEITEETLDDPTKYKVKKKKIGMRENELSAFNG